MRTMKDTLDETGIRAGVVNGTLDETGIRAGVVNGTDADMTGGAS